MKFFVKENLPYPQKLVMVFTIIITVFLATGFSASSSQSSTQTSTQPNTTEAAGPLAESLEKQTDTVTVNLLGVASYELTEIFNDIIETTPGVIKARRCQLHLDPEHPKAGRVEWQVTFCNTTPFALESAIYNRLKEITDSDVTTYLTNGFTINLTDNELTTLKAIKPGQSTSRTLSFFEMNVFAKNSPEKWHYNHPRVINNWQAYPNRGFE